MGGITEIATSAPGYSSMRPNSAATIAETLKLNGYSTAHFGKCHEVPVWETSPIGPFDRWPTGSGFEKFYGFIGGETNQWEPALYDGTTPIDPPADPSYHLTEDLAKQCTDWIRQQKALIPTSRSSSTSRPARPTPRTTSRRNGSTSTRASSIRAGTGCARRRWSGRRSWASSRRIAS